jgi:hypothetical protein
MIIIVISLSPSAYDVVNWPGPQIQKGLKRKGCINFKIFWL